MDSDIGALKEPQILHEINKCGTSLDNLETEVNGLEKRLQNVMSPPPPDKENLEKREKPLVNLAVRIDAINERIIITVKRIRDLKNRLEI